MPVFENAGLFENSHFFHESQTRLRVVQRYELEWIEWGNGFSCIDGERYAHLSQRILLRRPGSQSFSVGAYACRFVYFQAQNEQEAQLLNALPATAVAQGPLIHQLMEELARRKAAAESEDYFFRQAALCTLLGEVISLLKPAGQTAAETAPHFGAVLEAKAYMDACFGEKIDLEHLAEQVHLSRNFFRTCFQQVMGLSPHNYLQQVRLSHARKMLRSGSEPVSQIAQDCGFESQAYFNYVFKRQTGQTPLGYRKAKQQSKTTGTP